MDNKGAVSLLGKAAPQATELAIVEAGMTGRPFNPGRPIGPFDGYSTTPRSHDFVTGYNISARPRLNEAVSFETLRGMVKSYDFAQICIWHKIDSLRSLKWSLVPKQGVVNSQDDAIEYTMGLLRRPDRKTRLKTIMAKYMFDVFAYDAGCLAWIRNNANQVIGFKHVDGTTIAPLIDDWGDRPDYPAPAYVQYYQGVPQIWLTEQDLLYEPFRPSTTSQYGTAPIESVLLNANTDLRFQVYFMQRFTDGNVPEAFAGAPEGWTPDQIKQFQSQWDALLYGDQAAKHQIKWVPNGTTFAWSNEKDFDDAFSLFMARKTMAAYHVVPSDLGLTEDVNRATADTQVDVQFRIGDLPGIDFFEGTIDQFLTDGLQVPLEFKIDTGQESEDRYETAQADYLNWQMAVISSDELRELRYGKRTDPSQPLGRGIFSTRGGFVPLSAAYAVQGPIDPDTFAPQIGAALPHKPFVPIEGVVPNPPPPAEALAVEKYPADNAPAPAAAPALSEPVAKAETVGITSATGAEGSPLLQDPDDESDDEKVALAKAEIAAYRRFVKARRAGGKWRDFTFTQLDPVQAHRLNDSGRALIRKAAGELLAAGLCVQAADTGRVLMLQRGLDPTDPASGMFEFPGGHIEDGESPFEAAVREWQEEVGCLLPAAAIADAYTQGQTWAASNGVYCGYVLRVPSETSIATADRVQVTNPDDPDGDVVEAVAWWDPTLLAGNPAVRAELAADVPLVLGALGIGDVLAPEEPVAKAAGDAGPKASAGDPRWHAHPARKVEDRLVDHHADKIRAAMSGLISRDQLHAIAAAYVAQVHGD